MPPTDPLDQQRQNTQRTVLLATDSQNSMLAEMVGNATNHLTYSAYGHQSARQEVATRLGFNGELREAQTCWYLLGNGYRAYNPRLMRFHSPDSWSPFGRGGLNPYMYCVGDPVNYADPTGHWGVLALLSSARVVMAGFMTSSLGATLNLSSIVLRERMTLANGLGLISGITGSAAGAAAMANFTPRVSQLLSTTSVISGAASNYLWARSLRTIARPRTAASTEITFGSVTRFSRPHGSPPSYFSHDPRTFTHNNLIPNTVGIFDGPPPAYTRHAPRPSVRPPPPLPEYSVLDNSPLISSDISRQLPPISTRTEPRPMIEQIRGNSNRIRAES
jgi:RHS repeat-associated protein